MGLRLRRRYAISPVSWANMRRSRSLVRVWTTHPGCGAARYPPLFMACSGVGKLVAINDEKCLLSAIMRLSRFTVSRTERHLSRGFYGVVEGTGRRGRRARCRVARGVGRDAAARGPDRADRRPVGGAGRSGEGG